MALVQRGGQAAITGQVADYLRGVLRNVAQDQVEELTRAITQDIMMGGREAAEGIRATITAFAHDVMQTDVGQIIRGGHAELQGLTQELTNRGQAWVNMVSDQGQQLMAARNQPDTSGMVFDGERWNQPVIDRRPLPDLSDLEANNGQVISQNDRQVTSGSMNGAGSGSGSTEPSPTPEASAARAAVGGGPGGSVSKETPISPYPSLSYGLQETHTTILPYRYWCSGGLLDYGPPLQMEIRMNAIWDMIKSPVTTLASAGTIAAKAFHTLPVGPGGVHVATATFPMEPATGATERPQWRDFWVRLYENYTVLGCKWKVTIINVNNARGADIECAVQYDSYSDTNGTAGNIMPLANYNEVKAFKNIQWYRAEAATNENQEANNTMVISGTYKPGMISRNIKNDGDVKTWTAVGTTLPNLKEILTLNFYKAGLNYSTTANTAFNMCVELDYIVQFKDLKEQARYPSSKTTDQDIKILINDTNDSAGTNGDDVRYRQSVAA